jgi:hypothetical protein
MGDIYSADPSQISIYGALQTLSMLLKSGQRGPALNGLVSSLMRSPQDPDLLFNYAVLLGEEGMDDIACQIYKQCLRENPLHVDSLWNAGELYRLKFCFDIAYDYLSKFECIADYRMGLYHRIAVCLWHLGELDGAREYFKKALSKDPHPLTNWEYSLFLLSTKDYLNGFSQYRNRFLAGDRANVIYFGLGFPLWSGELSELDGRTLFLLAEQGLGDQVQFLACIRDFMGAVNGMSTEVFLLVYDELYELVKYSFSDLPISVHPFRAGREHSFNSHNFPYSFEFPIGDLPWAIQLSTPSFGPYLRAPDGAIAQASNWLKKCCPSKKIHIGIAWSTNGVNNSPARSARDIPIHEYLRLLNLPESILSNVNFISLAVGSSASEVYKLYKLGVTDFSYLIDNFSDTAGLIHFCDYVIAPCTSVAHVAGSMGKTVFLMLSKYGDWRWGNRQPCSDWYPDVRIFQQSNLDSWSDTVDCVVDAISREIQSKNYV